MRVSRVLILIAVLALVATMPGLAWERGFTWDSGSKIALARNTTVQIYGWKNDLFGDIDVKGMNLDLGSEADFSAKTRLGVTLTHGFSKKNNLTLSYNSFDHSGRINKTVTFDNRNYQAGASINLKNRWFDLAWSHNFNFWSQGGTSSQEQRGGFIDGMLGIKFSQADLDVAGYAPVTNAYTTGSWSESFPIPYLGIAAGSQVAKNLWLDGHLKFISVNAGDGSVRSMDFDLNAALRLNPQQKDTEWFATVGYRSFNIDGEADKDNVNVGYRGPTFGLLARF